MNKEPRQEISPGRGFVIYAVAMPNIKLKSIEYMEAAQELINKRIYNASVHCSYYSRLMQMKYILAHHKSPIDYNTQNEKLVVLILRSWCFSGKDNYEKIFYQQCIVDMRINL